MGDRGKGEEESVGEEIEQVHGDGIEQNMSTTSFAIRLFLFRLVVSTAMILNKSGRRDGRQGKGGKGRCLRGN